MRIILFLHVLGFALAGFRMPAGAADLSISETAAARKLYVVKCAKCHKFYDPAKYSDEQWQKWMAKMGSKAKLKPDELELLSRYIESNLRHPEKPGRQGPGASR